MHLRSESNRLALKMAVIIPPSHFGFISKLFNMVLFLHNETFIFQSPEPKLCDEFSAKMAAFFMLKLMRYEGKRWF